MKKIHSNISLTALRKRIQERDFIEKAAVGARLLSTAKFMLFNMYFVHGYSLNQIAELCNVWPGTISRRLHRLARELLGEYTNKSSWHRNDGGTRKSADIIFYSVYCLDCHFSFISKTFNPTCPKCGSSHIANHCKEVKDVEH